MTRFVATIGFSSHRVTRPIIAHGANSGDRVELLHPAQKDETAVERTEQAVSDAEMTLQGGVGQVSVVTHEMSMETFAEAVAACSDLLVNGPPPVVCIGGGATDVQVPLLVATVAHADQVADIMMFSDVDNSAERITMPQLPINIPGRVSSTFPVLLECLEQQQIVTISDLADAADISESSASRHVNDLNKHGLVSTDRVEQSKSISLTPLGRIIANRIGLSVNSPHDS